jgi:glycosyltransferase involved in cell wall biosynthesis
MRILWLKSDYVLPPDTGGKIRTYQLLRELHKLCEVTYVAFRPCEAVEDLPAGEFASRIATYHRVEENKQGAAFLLRVAAGMASSLPYIVQKYRSAQIQSIQRQWYTEADEDSRRRSLILCDFLEMTQNVDWNVPCPKILFQHNVESMIWKRYREHETSPLKKAYFSFESRRMAAYEARICRKFDLVLTVSEEDRQMLTKDFDVRVPVEVVETGVDNEFFAAARDVQTVPGRLLFLGSLDWMPNIDALEWFVEEVYPTIHAAHPFVTLDVVGRRPTPAVRRLQNRHSSIRVIADVADVRPHLGAADVCVVPLRIGGGSRLKIYEAMAAGRAVVSTSVGAEGLPLRAGEHLAIGDSAPDFAARVLELVENEAKKHRLSRNAQRFVAENCAWSAVAGKLHAACTRLVSRSSAAVEPESTLRRSPA